MNLRKLLSVIALVLFIMAAFIPGYPLVLVAGALLAVANLL